MHDTFAAEFKVLAEESISILGKRVSSKFFEFVFKIINHAAKQILSLIIRG